MKRALDIAAGIIAILGMIAFGIYLAYTFRV